MSIKLFQLCLLITLLLTLHMDVIYAQTYQNITQLKTDLFTGYDSTIIPKNDQTEVMNVSVTLNIYSIWDVDPINGIYTVMAGVFSTWKDDRLVWNPANYNGTSYIKLKQNTVWTPSLVPTNAMGMVDLGEKWMTVEYQSNGTAIWKPAQCLVLSCSFKMRYWPFDKQICKMAFTLYNQYSTEAEINPVYEKAILSYYSPHAEWELEDTYSYKIDYGIDSELVYGLKLVRQSTYYSLTIIIPLVSLNLLSALVFLLPAESGERIGYNITIMLSIVVFLILIGDHVPKTSDPMPLICGFLITLVTLSILCLVAAIYSLSLYHCEDDIPESSIYRTIVQIVSTPCRKKKTKISQNTNQGTDKAGDKIKVVPKRSTFKNKVDVVSVLENLDDKATLANLQRDHVFVEDDIDEVEVTWKDVSKAMDKLFFSVFLLLTMIPSIAIPLYMAIASTFPE